MKFVVITSGTRGDCQPYVAIALKLKEHGHQVLFLTEARMQAFVEGFGIEYKSFAGDPTAVIYEKESQEMLREGKILAIMKKMEAHMAPFAVQRMDDIYEHCSGWGAEAIITGGLTMVESFNVAEKLRIPFIPIALGPTVPTADFPMFFISSKPLWFGWMNKATYSLLFWAMWRNEKNKINGFRKKLSLPEITDSSFLPVMERAKIDMIIACPEFAFPTGKRPLDYPSSVHITNFIFVPKSSEVDIDEHLLNFLNSSDKKPVYLGFGSMPAPDPTRLIKLARHVVKQLKCRAILCAGWTELQDMTLDDPDLLVIKQAPHDYLLPRTSAIVHHCGAGTMAAALRSGVPSVAVPVMLDQPHNGNTLFNLGVSPAPLMFVELSNDKGVNTLLNNINTAMTNSQMKANAEKYRNMIESMEEGVDGTYKVIQEITQRKK